MVVVVVGASVVVVVVVGASVVVVVVVGASVVVVVVVGASVVVVVVVGASVVVVVVVVSSFEFTIVFVTDLSSPKSVAFTTVSGAFITYPLGASTSVRMYLSLKRSVTVILPSASVVNSPIT